MPSSPVCITVIIIITIIVIPESISLLALEILAIGSGVDGAIHGYNLLLPYLFRSTVYGLGLVL
jgi:hypothetical protein